MALGAVLIATAGVSSGHAFVSYAAPLLAAPVILWLFFSERYELTLVALLLYLGLVDGVVKLSMASTGATLIRDVLLYAIALGAVVRMILRRQRLTAPPLVGFVFAWVVVCVVQLANPANVSLLHAASSLRQHLEFVPLFFFGYLVLRSERRLLGLLMLVAAVAAINGIVALFQWHLTPQQFASWGPGYAKLIHGTSTLSGRAFVDANGVAHVRPTALGSDIGFGGAVGMVALPALAALIAMAWRRPRLWLLILVTAPLVVLAVWTSQARTQVVAAVVALIAFLALTMTSRRGVTAIVSIAVVGLTTYGLVSAVSGHTNSASAHASRYGSITPGKVIGTTIDYRKATFQLIPTYIVKYPLGAGLGSTGPASGAHVGGSATTSLDAESEFTFLLVETGIPGLVVMTTFMLVVIVVGLRLRAVSDVHLQRSLMALVAVLIGIFATWIVGIATAAPPSAPMFWLCAGTFAFWYGELRVGRLPTRQGLVKRALTNR